MYEHANTTVHADSVGQNNMRTECLFAHPWRYVVPPAGEGTRDTFSALVNHYIYPCMTLTCYTGHRDPKISGDSPA